MGKKKRWIRKYKKFMCNISKDIIRYFSTVASEDLVYIYIYIYVCIYYIGHIC